MYLFSTNPADYAISCAEDEIIVVQRYIFPSTEHSDYQDLDVPYVMDSHEFQRMLKKNYISENDGQYYVEYSRPLTCDCDVTVDSIPLSAHGEELREQGISVLDLIDQDWWAPEIYDLYTRDQFVKEFKIPCQFT